MSITLRFIRDVQYTQVNNHFGASYKQLRDLSGEDFPITGGRYVEIMTSGWPAGDRCRVKRFRNIHAVYAYFNKLLFGKWISDDDYSVFWDMALRFDYGVNHETSGETLENLWNSAPSVLS
jgi:hypothetical protein